MYERAIRIVVARLLRRAGFQALEATDGQHLIETQPRMMAKTVVMTSSPEDGGEERLHYLCCIISKPFETDEPHPTRQDLFRTVNASVERISKGGPRNAMRLRER